jgi:hypothetical protein
MNLSINGSTSKAQFDFRLPTTSQTPASDIQEIYHQINEKSWLRVEVSYTVTPVNPVTPVTP